MITKLTFVAMINSMERVSMDETMQDDLLTMLETVMLNQHGIIRDFLFKRDRNGELFFGLPTDNGIEIFLITSTEDLYEYLIEQAVEQITDLALTVL
jgi:hypothetical protein